MICYYSNKLTFSPRNIDVIDVNIEINFCKTKKGRPEANVYSSARVFWLKENPVKVLKHVSFEIVLNNGPIVVNPCTQQDTVIFRMENCLTPINEQQPR